MFGLRCSGGFGVMQDPRSSLWRSQLMTSDFGCWTPPSSTTHSTTTSSIPPRSLHLWWLYGASSASAFTAGCVYGLWLQQQQQHQSASPMTNPGAPWTGSCLIRGLSITPQSTSTLWRKTDKASPLDTKYTGESWLQDEEALNTVFTAAAIIGMTNLPATASDTLHGCHLCVLAINIMIMFCLHI